MNIQPVALVVEDEDDITTLLEFSLRKAGFAVVCVKNLSEARTQVKKALPDVVVLDWMLPDGEGVTWLNALRADVRTARLPVLMLTARAQEMDKLKGLELGADDYITKPFNPRELTIRARNLLGRTLRGEPAEEPIAGNVSAYRFNGWTLDINSRSLINPSNVAYRLPRSEFRALLHFCENPGQIQTRADLLLKMTGRELKPHDRTVDVTIRRIRKHFEDYPDTPELITTIHGEGYRFCADLEQEING